MSQKTPDRIFQAAAIPYRMKNGLPEFCLITSLGSGNWGFPKGIIDPGETPVETALKEADEEAGLSGQIVGKPLGSYTYAKWDTSLDVTVFLMKVTDTAALWDEMEMRERCWCDESEARRRLSRKDYTRLLETAVKRIAKRG